MTACVTSSVRGSGVCCASSSASSAPRHSSYSQLAGSGDGIASGAVAAAAGRCRVGRCSGARRSIVDDGGVRLVNVARTIDLPWPSIVAVDTKWALTLVTAYGRFTGWAAPAPGLRQTMLAGCAQETATCRPGHVADAASDPVTCRRRPSGDAALLIRRPMGGAARRGIPRQPATRARRTRRSPGTSARSSAAPCWRRSPWSPWSSDITRSRLAVGTRRAWPRARRCAPGPCAWGSASGGGRRRRAGRRR